MEEQPLLKEEVVPQLWMAYVKTSEYKSGEIKAIRRNHSLIKAAEGKGLELIYINFIDNLNAGKFMLGGIKKRKALDWLSEWKNMNNVLFKYVFKDRGNWRKIDVWFGNKGDEDLHKVPLASNVPYEINFLGESVNNFCKKNYTDPNKLFPELAKIHYRFIRIHPFKDGNGRIARAVTDQLALLNGFPPAMGGFPRFETERRKAYHKAIMACIEDKECEMLAGWIRSYFDQQMRTIA